MCRVLNIDLKTTGEIATAFENYEIEDLDKLVAAGGTLPEQAKRALRYAAQYPDLFRYVRKLNGLPKSFGLHACFPADTSVLTSDGYKSISDIAAGDLVLTHTGVYKRVCEVMESEANELISIRATGSMPFKCTGNHPILTKKRLSKTEHIFSEPVWEMASNVEWGDLVGIPIPLTETPISYKSLPCESNDFWWMIGRWLGDGWTERPAGRNEKRIMICCNKTSIKYLNDIIKHTSGYFKLWIEDARTTYKVHIHSDDLYDFLQRFGRYAPNKAIDPETLGIPKKQLEALLDGYFSADGYVTKHGEQSFKTTSKKLALSMMLAIAKVYSKHCGIHYIRGGVDVIEGRTVTAKEKYTVQFTKDVRPKQRCFCDGQYIWCRVNKVGVEAFDGQVYNLAVEDDNSYTANNITVHNCGRVISTNPLDIYLPSCYDKDGIRYLQGDMHDVEDVGLVKIDVLGLRTVDQMYDTMEMLGESLESIDPKRVDFTDQKVLDVFKNGDTVGIFQFSSGGMRKTLKNMDPRGIDDLSIANALFRPGSLAYIDSFCKRRRGEEECVYIHPDLEPILRITYGIIVFQEQLIEIGRLAGIRNPDLLRKATGKKDIKLLEQVKPELSDKLMARGWSEDQFNQLWSDMLAFASYSFNKAHSQAYAIIGFLTAKQKAYHPAEFFAGLCNSYLGQSSYVKDDADEIISDMLRMGVKLAPFDFRQDHRRCWVNSAGQLEYAIPLIRDCSDGVAQYLYEIRNNVYTHFWQLLRDISGSCINQSQISSLIQLGFFSEFGIARKLWQIMGVCQFLSPKSGEFAGAKQISKEKIDSAEFLYPIIAKHSSDVGVKGDVLKSFRIQDVESILNEAEEYILSIECEDFSFQERIKAQQHYLGFISMNTGKEEDRRYVYVKAVRPAFAKKTGRQFGTHVIIRSIGSGKESLLTIMSKDYKDEVVAGDIVYLEHWTRTDRGYFNLDKYRVVL